METQISLSDSVRKQIAQNLIMLLADTYILYVKTQNFHWNMTDARFYSLHLFLKKEYGNLGKAIDEIAERIRILGERFPTGLKQFLNTTSLKESDEDLIGEEMILELLKDHEAICLFLRDCIALTTKLGDEGSADLLTQRLRAHEKSIWMLQSHVIRIT